MSAKISIIIPVYNVEKYLPECLDSIIAQTLSDIEIICINDGSPDNSLSILKDYAAKDSRIIIIDKENEGVGKARNDGMRAATGEFIAFMDSDDYYPGNDVLEKLYNAAKEHNVKVCGGKKIYLLPEGNFEQEKLPVKQHEMEFSLKIEEVNSFSDYQYDYGYSLYIYDRKMIIDNNCFFPDYKRFQDPPFFVNAMILANEFYVCDINSYCYRRIRTLSKYSIRNTKDQLHGLTDNLIVSRKNNLPKLHLLTAQRLNKDASFMAIQNLFNENKDEMLSLFIKATATVDVEWLKSEGYPITEPFIPEVFEYAVSAAEKFEKIRNNKAFKAASKLLGR